MDEISLLRPDWNAPHRVSACVTTRSGGYSHAPYDSFNLADHVGDDARRVNQNRERLRRSLKLPGEPVWLQQVHGNTVVDAARCEIGAKADASYTREQGVVCAVMTADCLPVFFCNTEGDEVAVAHAGWRGLARGVLEATLAAMRTPSAQIMAWLGPAIGPQRFEVGDEVRAVFEAEDPIARQAFHRSTQGRWLADIYLLARQRLQKAGVENISGGGRCTYLDKAQFFSYRREGARSGRMASLIWK